MALRCQSRYATLYLRNEFCNLCFRRGIAHAHPLCRGARVSTSRSLLLEDTTCSAVGSPSSQCRPCTAGRHLKTPPSFCLVTLTLLDDSR